MWNNLQYILFDLGNTLIYMSEPWEVVFTRGIDATLKSLTSSGVRMDPDALRYALRNAMDDYYVLRERNQIELTTTRVMDNLLISLGISDLGDRVLSQAVEAFYQVTRSYWFPEDDSIDLLEALRDHGFRLGIISNAAHDPDVHLQVRSAGLESFLDFVITSAAFGLRKPHRTIFQAALNRWDGALPENTLMVGDNLEADIFGANRLGIRSVWITRRVDNPLTMLKNSDIHPDFQIAKLRELENLLIDR